MMTPLSTAESAHLEASLSTPLTPSMLDGYLAAAASGPNFVMPDQVLRWVWPTGQPADQDVANLIVRMYRAVNDALNDQSYLPNLTDTQEWCRGYLAGVAADMMAWAPLMAARPELLKVIMSESGDLAYAARRIHDFWIARRRQEIGISSLLEQLAAMSPEASMPNQLPH
jgi:hypothetical protein